MKKAFKKISFLMSIIILITAACFIIQKSELRDDAIFLGMSAASTGLTLVIDAGHGGADGGAVSLSGVKESEINFEIAAKLDQIMGFYGVQTIMTRTSESLDYSPNSNSIREKKVEDQNKRIQLINRTRNAVLISIHQNKFSDGSPFGAQVLFAPTNGSKEFAEYMQRLLISTLNTKNRRSAARVPKNILLMNHCSCPAILIECGFLSNSLEEKLLRTDAYRLKIAAVIAAGYLDNQDTLLDINSGGTNEG